MLALEILLERAIGTIFYYQIRYFLLIDAHIKDREDMGMAKIIEKLCFLEKFITFLV